MHTQKMGEGCQSTYSLSCSESQPRSHPGFNDCFELKDGERITASKLCEIMKLRGYKKYDNHLYKWLDAHFADHEFVRKIRPRNVRTWLGIKPRVALKRCNACGASCIARVAVAG